MYRPSAMIGGTKHAAPSPVGYPDSRAVDLRGSIAAQADQYVNASGKGGELVGDGRGAVVQPLPNSAAPRSGLHIP